MGGGILFFSAMFFLVAVLAVERKHSTKQRRPFRKVRSLNKTTRNEKFLPLVSSQRASLFASKSCPIGIAMATNGSYIEAYVPYHQL